ncbi:MAG: peptidoglycan DD-metalloendopeptidase family protein [Microthrixaceae bacterium]|nr:peptidoglycan DD-metalloendopeptidase family protein [Microthrixaceae bacterium]
MEIRSAMKAPGKAPGVHRHAPRLRRIALLASLGLLLAPCSTDPASAAPGKGHVAAPAGPEFRAAADRARVDDGTGRVWVDPVQVEVRDPFRPPDTEWGAGNRGWEYATMGGESVVAVGDGVVAFAGRVAGRGVVTIDHGAGLLSSVTGLRSVSVEPGAGIAAGDPLGAAMPGLHLGFRRHGDYVDPAGFLGGSLHAILVPVPVPD